MQTRADREKLALMKSLADEAFRQIDQGQGIEIDSELQLGRFISRIGRRLAAATKTEDELKPPFANP